MCQRAMVVANQNRMNAVTIGCLHIRGCPYPRCECGGAGNARSGRRSNKKLPPTSRPSYQTTWSCLVFGYIDSARISNLDVPRPHSTSRLVTPDAVSGALTRTRRPRESKKRPSVPHETRLVFLIVPFRIQVVYWALAEDVCTLGRSSRSSNWLTSSKIRANACTALLRPSAGTTSTVSALEW